MQGMYRGKVGCEELKRDGQLLKWCSESEPFERDIMKAKKYWVWVVVSLIAILGSVIYADEAEKIEKIFTDFVIRRHALNVAIKRSFFLQGVMLTDIVVKNTRDVRRSSKDILEGIREVSVLVFPPSKVEQYGLTAQVLHTDTELRLRRHGIKVIREAKDSMRLSELQLQEETKRFNELNEHIVGIWAEPGKPLKPMKEPFKSLFEGLENYEKYQKDVHGKLKKGEHVTDEGMQHIFFKCIRDFLQYREQPPWPTLLWINITAVISEETDLASLYVSLQVRETVILERNRSLACTEAITWERDRLITIELNRLNEVRLDVKDLVDEFINDYLAANPKETEAKSKNNK